MSPHSRSAGLIGAAALALSGAAAAQAQAPEPEALSPVGVATLEPAPQGERGQQVFISPSGQPFRAPAGAAYPVALWFAQVDKRGDGKVDKAEFLADAKAFFETLDVNHDGVIDAFELQAYEQKIAPELLGAYRIPEGAPKPFPRGAGGAERRRGGLFGGRGGGSQGADPGDASVLDGAAPYALIPDPEPVASADFSMDGRITLAEFLRAAGQRFDRLDSKHVGYLTLAALPKTVAQTDAERAARGRPQTAGR